MAVSIMGLSTLGITFGYGVETSAGTKPATFTQLERINNIGGISMDTEQIDASALEDLVTKYIAGRQDTGGTWNVTFNFTPETEEQWQNAINAYNTAKSNSLNTWFEVIVPNQSNAFFVIAEFPQEIPMPEIGQNELLTVEVGLSIIEYKGLSAKVPFAGTSA